MSPDVRAVEEFTTNAWPCLRQVLLDGWILRFGAGYTRRSNSVHPLYPGKLDPSDKVRTCERMYERLGLQPVFKLTPASDPRELEQVLLEAGYAKESGASVRLADLTALDLDRSAPLRTWDRPADEWIEAFTTFNNRDPDRRAALAAMLANIVPQTLFLALPHDGRIASVAMAVAQPPWVGLFNMATDPALRRRGFGRQVVTAALQWGRESGASTGCLQVSVDNEPAQKLYSEFGFAEAYQYHYFLKPAAPA